MIEKHPFGRTGHQSTRTIFGAAAFSRVTQEEADRTFELLLERGVNHIDTAASYVDLIQLHNLADPGEWETAMGPGGALEAAVEAREQGLVRHIGVTGHGLTIAAMHRRSLERFDFDSILLPYNYVMHQNEHYREDFDAVVRLCEERQVA